MKIRIKSGLLMVPILAFVWVGGYVLLAACVALSVFAVREFYRAFETATVDSNRPIRPSYKVGVAGIILLYVMPFLFGGEIAWIVVCTVMCFALLFLKDERSVTDSLVTMAGLFYVALFISFIYNIDFNFDPLQIAFKAGNESLWETVLPSIDAWGDHSANLFYFHGFRYNFVWLVIFTAFATDIFAYFVGYKWGKHKLAPVLSPKKTVEGSIGGIVGSVLVCGVFGYFAMPEFLVHCIIIGALGGVVSQAGDITASAIKRRLGLKDYGNLIPGHGGLLDRIDSILFTAPFVYLYLSVVSGWTMNGDMHTPAFEYIWQAMNGTVDASALEILGR
ncbi:MAG: phosphatidate cytidylyltransferase [Clostridiales Family XIII bacterium]|nr:phosphatidate cytidylyltransferase [Clostridiales Family XIII bacterium]